MTAPRSGRFTGDAGFTITELVVVIAIIGALAAVAIPRMLGKEGFESRGFYDQVTSVVRFAQKTAIAQRRDVFVSISSSRVAACYVDATCGSRVVAPVTLPKSTDLAKTNCADDLTWLCAGVPSAGISISPAPTSFSFDALGRSSLGSALVVSVTSNAPGEGARTLTIEVETGYVHR